MASLMPGVRPAELSLDKIYWHVASESAACTGSVASAVASRARGGCLFGACMPIKNVRESQSVKRSCNFTLMACWPGIPWLLFSMPLGTADTWHACQLQPRSPAGHLHPGASEFPACTTIKRHVSLSSCSVFSMWPRHRPACPVCLALDS